MTSATVTPNETMEKVAMRGQQRRKRDSLRCLRAPHQGTVERAGHLALLGLLERVGDRHREQAAVLVVGLVAQALEIGPVEAGARGVVHQHDLDVGHAGRRGAG